MFKETYKERGRLEKCKTEKKKISERKRRKEREAQRFVKYINE